MQDLGVQPVRAQIDAVLLEHEDLRAQHQQLVQRPRTQRVEAITGPLHQISLTSCLPKFLPLSRPRKASGAAAMPSATVSRDFSLPVATRLPSSFSASGHTSMCSETMKPSIFIRLTRISWGALIGMGSPL